MGTQLPYPKKGSRVFGPCQLWPKRLDGSRWQLVWRYKTRLTPHCARWGPSSPPEKGSQPLPQFSAHVYSGQTAELIKMLLGVKVGLGPGDFVFDGNPERKHSPSTQFLALVYCGQTAGWIKTPLGTEVGLGHGHIVLDGDSAPLPQRGKAPNLRSISASVQATLC